MLSVAVLGPTEIHRDGVRLPIPSGKPTELLVRLALDAGRPVRAERLIEELWGDAALGTGRNTLQAKVSQLRRALGEPRLIGYGAAGYTLWIDDSRVDAVQVVGLAAGAAAARRAGDPATAADLAAQGLALFRGEVLVDAGAGDWLHPHRIRLVEVRLGLLEDRFGARLDLGAGGEVIGDLEGLVQDHPLHEGLWCCLITALYRTGRQADALAAYARVRRVLVDELGIEPGPALRSLEDQILQQSPALDLTGDGVPPTRVLGPGGNLPALSSPLIGRGADLAALARLVPDRRLVTVVGPAGVGKTRTVIEVARRLEAPGGVWLVRLDAADAAVAATSLPRLVAETLQVVGGEARLLERLAGVETVLVLDNCEHVVGAVADLVGRLLDATTELRVLATSQLPLGVDGELVHPLEPLSLEDSVALFSRRAAELRRQFVLDADTAGTVEEVCRALDGLPLAIELAAARIRSLSVQEIARRLDDRFALLRDPTSRRPERRRALAAAIAWSYELLFPDDQRGLWALSCFAGGAPLAAAEHVLAALGVPETAAVDVVGRLVDRSLVSVEFGDRGAVRYRLLDSIRAYALDLLRDSGALEDARAAHARWFAGEADRCAATVRGTAQPECLALVRAERANVDAALAWAARSDPALGVRIANGFGWTWVVLGDGVAGAARVRGALDAAGDLATARDRATGLLLAGWLEASAGDVGRAEADLDAASGLAEQLADEMLRADVQRHRAFLRIQQSRPHEVLEQAAAALAVYRPLGPSWDVAGSLLLAAFGSIMLGDTRAATEAAEEAVRLLTPIGDSWGLVHADAMLGGIAQAEHRFEAATEALSRAAAASEQLGFRGQAALHLTTLGRVRQRAGDPVAAARTLRRAIEAADIHGDLRIGATARVNLARVLRGAGDDGSALPLLEHADRWYRASGGGDGALLARCLLIASSAESDGTPDATPDGTPGGTATTAVPGATPSATPGGLAVRQLNDVLKEADRTGDLEVQVLASDALARVAADRGELEEALRLLRAADAALPGVAHRLDEPDRTDAHRARALLATPGDS